MINKERIITPLDFELNYFENAKLKVSPGKKIDELDNSHSIIFLAGLQENIFDYNPINSWYSHFIIDLLNKNDEYYIFTPKIDLTMSYLEFLDNNKYSLIELMTISNYVFNKLSDKIIFNFDDEIKNSLLIQQFDYFCFNNNFENNNGYILCQNYSLDELNDPEYTDYIAQKLYIKNNKELKTFTCMDTLISNIVYGD